MFEDQSFEPVECRPVTASETLKISNTTQTDEIMQKSCSVQKTESRNVQAQTTSETQQQVPEIDYAKLAKFLKRVTPSILEALDEIHGNAVVEAFERITLGSSTPQIQLFAQLSTLEPPNPLRKISDICWSINGGLLAVSYSNIHHESWCDHLSEIRIYEFSRQDKLQEKKTFETSSCCTCLAYHPTEPSVLAAGLFNGDVILWNFRDDTSITPQTIATHGDVVTCLHWRPRTMNDPSLLVTSSSDGYIFVHKLMENSTNISPHQKFKIVREHNPIENRRPRSAGGRRERAVEPGLHVTSLDFSRQADIFIVGTLCGGLYKCSMQASNPIQGDETTIDPVIGEFDCCEGAVTCVQCSPMSNIFVASNTNKEIRVFDIPTANLLRVITVSSTVTGLTWIIADREVMAAYGADSAVNFFDIKTGDIYRDMKIQSTRINTASLDFNQNRNTIAIGDTQGNVDLWKIQ